MRFCKTSLSGVPDGPEEMTPASSITNVTDVSTEKNISTSQASIDSESTLKSEDLHVNKEFAKLRSLIVDKTKFELMRISLECSKISFYRIYQG